MTVSGVKFSVNSKASFNPIGKFKYKTVEAVINFAFDMTFGLKGEHRHSRSGGTISRGNLEIFVNTFQGKLSEYAVANILYQHKDFKEPDLSTHGLGVWEDVDFLIGDNAIAVKSTKSFGNLILLETSDWNSQGEYIASVSELKTYSHIVLVRIKPDTEEALRNFQPNMNLKIAHADLYSLLISLPWEYDIPGYITKVDLINIIKTGLIIPKGAYLNNSVKMDAENYYIQAGDLRPVKELLSDLVG